MGGSPAGAGRQTQYLAHTRAVDLCGAGKFRFGRFAVAAAGGSELGRQALGDRKLSQIARCAADLQRRDDKKRFGEAANAALQHYVPSAAQGGVAWRAPLLAIRHAVRTDADCLPYLAAS